MSHWQAIDHQRASAWNVVRDLGADVALLQETAPPAGLDNVVYREIGDGVRSSPRTWCVKRPPRDPVGGL